MSFSVSRSGILGRRQTASQEFLELPFGGSNPPAPAISSNQEVRDEEQVKNPV